jgi:prolyl-tRNA synthetase
MASRSKSTLPGQKTIEDVAKFLGVSPKNKIKTLALMAEEKDENPARRQSARIVVLMRGDHQLNEAKLNGSVGGKETRPMDGRRNQSALQFSCRISRSRGNHWAKDMAAVDRPVLLVDKALEGRKNLISGANKEDYHLKNLTPGKNFHPTAYVDLRA